MILYLVYCPQNEKNEIQYFRHREKAEEQTEEIQ